MHWRHCLDAHLLSREDVDFWLADTDKAAAARVDLTRGQPQFFVRDLTALGDGHARDLHEQLD